MVNINVQRFSRAKAEFLAELSPTPTEPEPPVENPYEKPEIVEPVPTGVGIQSTDEDPEDHFSGLSRTGFEAGLAKEAADAAYEIALAEEEKRRAKAEQEHVKMIERIAKKRASEAKKKKPPAAVPTTGFPGPGRDDDNDSLFGDRPTEVLGAKRRGLLLRIRQYKHTFPDELKSFRLKRNATETELEAYLQEMQDIVEMGSTEEFLIESVYQCVKIVEPLSTYTRYDLRGLSDMLRCNPQFTKLSRALFCKYNAFSALPVEVQMIMCVTTTAWICAQKNAKEKEIQTLLDAPLNNSHQTL